MNPDEYQQWKVKVEAEARNKFINQIDKLGKTEKRQKGGEKGNDSRK